LRKKDKYRDQCLRKATVMNKAKNKQRRPETVLGTSTAQRFGPCKKDTGAKLCQHYAPKTRRVGTIAARADKYAAKKTAEYNLCITPG